MRPVVALLTDFGVRDHYAGTMKGVVLTICPDVTLVDVSHEVPPHDVLTAALELAACYRYFPAGTIFLVVVDPGVGSVRRPIAAEAGDYRFVAPDNGVLSAVFKETPPKRVVELTERRYARPTVSRTGESAAPRVFSSVRATVKPSVVSPSIATIRSPGRTPALAADFPSVTLATAGPLPRATKVSPTPAISPRAKDSNLR